MEFYETESGRIGLREIPPLVAELLRQMTRWTAAESAAAEERIFPAPGDSALEDLNADWRAHVEPGLDEAFRSNREKVDADLRGMAEKNGTFAVEFSRAHAEAWLNALNQARLALAAIHRFSDGELERHGPPVIRSERDLALFQIHFYAMIQGWLIDLLDGE
jgi:hypothetical protein